ncbi:sugar transferase [Flagellimonas flava]|uniref:Sugar transferase involved in LPS biosynthesis (Colanic, teichoic acid) n=1 Tax=Flagellimonas flava TaxID=570519 RepID=A0A1M5J6W5_9FLAO|nr:sugar transferase [Allomuricauda flava]SHG36282.1 Sugar transferase involved in LPS biosynthesis (colanic, teichoic acid) [Allomuricauda flava]
MSNNLYHTYFKRFFDFSASLLGVIALSPVFIILTIVLWIDFKGSPFFFQERPGKDEKIFKIIKFKSMNNKKDANGNLLSNRVRTTKAGRFIRKYSLDEIPQLLNVIKGDMSLVGPRPLAVQYLPYYNEIERKRHMVRPGITGAAQVAGRNSLVWEERFSLDVDYVENSSLALDVKILYKTVLKIISKSEVAIDQDEFLDIFDVYRKKQWERANAS